VVILTGRDDTQNLHHRNPDSGAATTGLRNAPAYGRLVSSAQSFQHYFQDLKGACASLNPVERFVFSLILANTQTSRPDQQVLRWSAAPNLV